MNLRSDKLEFGLQLILLMVVIIILMGGYVFFINPRTTIPGVCLLREVTGMLCTFCGGTRALENLIAGNVTAALRYNALVVFLLPLFFYGVFLLVKSIWRRQSLAAIKVSPGYLWLLLIIVVLFTIIRNVFLFI